MIISRDFTLPMGLIYMIVRRMYTSQECKDQQPFEAIRSPEESEDLVCIGTKPRYVLGNHNSNLLGEVTWEDKYV